MKCLLTLCKRHMTTMTQNQSYQYNFIPLTNTAPLTSKLVTSPAVGTAYQLVNIHMEAAVASNGVPYAFRVVIVAATNPTYNPTVAITNNGACYGALDLTQCNILYDQLYVAATGGTPFSNSGIININLSEIAQTATFVAGTGNMEPRLIVALDTNAVLGAQIAGWISTSYYVPPVPVLQQDKFARNTEYKPSV